MTEPVPIRRRDPGPARTPPHDLEAEESLLGAMLLSRDAIADGTDTVTGTDFYKPAHGHVFDAILHLDQAGHPVDPVTVADELRRSDLLDSVGGQGALIGLQAATPATSNAGRYARIIQELATLRRIIGAAAEITNLAYSLPDDVPDAAGRAERLIQQAADHTTTTHPETAHQMMIGWLESLIDTDRTPGVPTPWARLNEITGGLRPGLHVFFARPGTGKSAMGLNLGEHAAEAGHPTLLCSLEMDKTEISDRLVALRTGLSHTLIRDRTLGDHDLDRVSAAAAKIATLPLHVLDDTDLTVARIGAAARRIPGLAMVIVDYLQLITPPPGRHGNRQEEVSAVCKALIRLRKRLQVPVVALAQAKRPDTTRKDMRPTIGELRESGSMESDGDLVVSLYRDEMYDPQTKDRGVMELYVHKQRNGPSQKKVRTAWNGTTFRIADLAHQPDEEI